VLRSRLFEGSIMPQISTPEAAKRQRDLPAEHREFDRAASSELNSKSKLARWSCAQRICPVDHRRSRLKMHRKKFSQGVFGIALGYEDLNDHDDLRHDPVMAVS
jgi:hypothetical protein